MQNLQNSHNTRLLYGSDSWTITEADKEKLRIFERRILRRIYGPTCENIWRI
jgi:hypothetical protein